MQEWSVNDDADIAEWRRLRHWRQLLEPLVLIFERTNSACIGDCEKPKLIYQDKVTGEKITCCNLRYPWDRYHEIRKLERMLNSKVSTGRKPSRPTTRNREVESPLGDAYPRSHTGEYQQIQLRGKPKAKPKGH